MEGHDGTVAGNEGKQEARVMMTPSPEDSDVESTIGSSTSYKLASSFAVPDVGSIFKDEEDETTDQPYQNRSRNLFVRCILFVCLGGILIASLTVPKLKDTLIWGSELWKWTVFVLDILFGWSICKWLIVILAVRIGDMCHKEVHSYLVRGMRKSVGALIWLGSILLAWVFLINRGVERSKNTTKILDHVTKALVGCLVGAAIWFVKSFLIKLLAFSFQHGRFVDRIEKASFYRRVVSILPHLLVATDGRLKPSFKRARYRLPIFYRIMRVIKRIIERLVESMRVIKLIIEKLVESMEMAMEDRELLHMDTENPRAVEEGAEDVYNKVSDVAWPDPMNIHESKLRQHMNNEYANRFLRLFPSVKETGSIQKESLKDWLVESYMEYKDLKHSLNRTRRAVEKLHRLASGIAMVIAIIVWCMIMGFLTTQVLVLIFSQIAVAAFMFGNTAKTLFEAIIFVFIMHPFDVGDQCAVDDEQMLVEEINILHTTFRRNDMQKIFYPNAVLLGKPILNSFRNPEMEDSVEFNIDLSTSAETIDDLKERIKGYLEEHPEQWLPKHSVVVKDIDNTGNLKMALCVTHNINFQNSGKKSSRRSNLILELKRILEKLDVKYRLLPQEVHVKYI